MNNIEQLFYARCCHYCALTTSIWTARWQSILDYDAMLSNSMACTHMN